MVDKSYIKLIELYNDISILQWQSEVTSILTADLIEFLNWETKFKT